MVRQIERGFLIDVVSGCALTDMCLINIDIPKTEHLVTRDLNLCFTVSSCDRCAILRAIFAHVVRSLIGSLGVIILHLGTVEVLSVSWRLTLAN